MKNRILPFIFLSFILSVVIFNDKIDGFLELVGIKLDKINEIELSGKDNIELDEKIDLANDNSKSSIKKILGSSKDVEGYNNTVQGRLFEGEWKVNYLNVKQVLRSFGKAQGLDEEEIEKEINLTDLREKFRLTKIRIIKVDNNKYSVTGIDISNQEGKLGEANLSLDNDTLKLIINSEDDLTVNAVIGQDGNLVASAYQWIEDKTIYELIFNNLILEPVVEQSLDSETPQNIPTGLTQEIIDWQIGPLSPLFWDMSYSDFPIDYLNENSDSDENPIATPYNDISVNLMLQNKSFIYSSCRDVDFEFYGVEVKKVQFEKVGNLRKPNILEVLPKYPILDDYDELKKLSDAERRRLSTDEYIRITDRDYQRYEAALKNFDELLEKVQVQMNNFVAQSISDAKLKAIYLLPNNNDNLLIKYKLYENFNQNAKIDKYEFHFEVFNKGVVKSIFTKYVTYSWNDKNDTIVEYHEVFEDDLLVKSFIVIGNKETLNELDSFKNTVESSISSIQLNNLLIEMKNRNWEIGYGWLRGRIDNPIDLPNNDVRTNMYYMLESGRFNRYIHFSFDAKGILNKFVLIPSSENNPNISPMKMLTMLFFLQ